MKNIIARRTRATALLLTATTALTLAVSTVPATAAQTAAERKTVCADSLAVRETAPHGAWMGTLYKGQTFLVEEPGGNWVYGFAYGDINRRGWVQSGWFC